MNIGSKTSWQLVAVAAAALLGGVAQADGRDHRGRGDDSGWRHHDGRHDGRYHRQYNRHYDRGWHHGHRHHHHHGYRPRHWVPLPPPPHWRHGPPHHHRHYYDSYYRSNYWIPERGGVHVTIGFPLY